MPMSVPTTRDSMSGRTHGSLPGSQPTAWLQEFPGSPGVRPSDWTIQLASTEERVRCQWHIVIVTDSLHVVTLRTKAPSFLST